MAHHSCGALFFLLGEEAIYGELRLMGSAPSALMGTQAELA